MACSLDRLVPKRLLSTGSRPPYSYFGRTCLWLGRMRQRPWSGKLLALVIGALGLGVLAFGGGMIHYLVTDPSPNLARGRSALGALGVVVPVLGLQLLFLLWAAWEAWHARFDVPQPVDATFQVAGVSQSSASDPRGDRLCTCGVGRARRAPGDLHVWSPGSSA
jgi:hypothetical protein